MNFVKYNTLTQWNQPMRQQNYHVQKNIQVVTKPEIKATLLKMANDENRTLSKFISLILEDYVKQHEVKNSTKKLV